MPPSPLVPGRTPDSADRALARMIAEELAFALSTQATPVKVKNLPQEQRVTGEVLARLRGLPELMGLLDSLKQAVYDTEYQPPEVQKVEVTNRQDFPEFPEIPAFPEEIATTLKDFPALKKHLEAIEQAVKAIEVKPRVEVKPADVKVQAPDLSSLAARLEAIEDAVRDIPAPVQPRYGPVVDQLKEVRESIDSLIFPSPERLPKDASGNLRVTVVGQEATSLEEISLNYDRYPYYATFSTPSANPTSRRLLAYVEFTTDDGEVYRKTYAYDEFGEPTVIPTWARYVVVPPFDALITMGFGSNSQITFGFASSDEYTEPEPPPPITDGNPIGLLLSLTYGESEEPEPPPPLVDGNPLGLLLALTKGSGGGSPPPAGGTPLGLLLTLTTL